MLHKPFMQDGLPDMLEVCFFPHSDHRITHLLKTSHASRSQISRSASSPTALSSNTLAVDAANNSLMVPGGSDETNGHIYLLAAMGPEIGSSGT